MGWVRRVLRRPWAAHWGRALDRFGRRLGFSLAAGLTFSMVLAVVPVAMVTFGLLGLALTTWFPDLIVTTRQSIADVFAPHLGDRVTAVLQRAFDSWPTVGLLGLPMSLLFGTWWITRTRMAVRVMVFSDFRLPRNRRFRLKRLGRSVAILLLVQVVLACSVALLAAATAAREWILRTIADHGGSAIVAGLAPFLPTLGAAVGGFAVFALIFVVFPVPAFPAERIIKAAALGGVGVAILQVLTSWMLGLLLTNVATAVFGSTIAIMVSFDLFAILLLLISAWTGTTATPAAEAVRLARHLVRRAPLAYTSVEIRRSMTRAAPTVVPRTVATARGLGVGAGAVAGIVVAVGLALLAAAIHRSGLGLRSWSGSAT